MKAIETSFNFTDMTSLKQLGNAQATDESLKAAAKQLEGVFLQMVMKSMRQATDAFSSSMFQSQTQETFQDFHDHQLSLHMAQNQGIGLADVIYNQLKPYVKQDASNQDMQMPKWTAPTIKQETGEKVTQVTTVPAKAPEPTTAKAKPLEQEPKWFEKASDFIEHLTPIVRQVTQNLPVNPAFLLAQAALETGWGKHVIQSKEQSSHNLFNIKASNWKGDSVSKQTLEYLDNQVELKVEPFRVYESYKQGIEDFVELLHSPRYQQALAHGQDAKQFFDSLHSSGYATDPNYVSKILKVLDNPLLDALGGIYE